VASGASMPSVEATLGWKDSRRDLQIFWYFHHLDDSNLFRVLVLGSSRGTIKVSDVDIDNGVSTTFEEATNGDVTTLLRGGG
jgi:hypothetical protein